MTRPRFLADHDLKHGILEGTFRRQPDLDFTRVSDFGLETHSDREVLSFAAREGRIVVSHDVNTMTAAAREVLGRREAMHGLLLIHQIDSVASAIDDLILI